MNAYCELMRRKLLEEVYEGLSPEDKRLFVQLTMQDKSWSEIAQALQQQQAQLNYLTLVLLVVVHNQYSLQQTECLLQQLIHCQKVFQVTLYSLIQQ